MKITRNINIEIIKEQNFESHDGFGVDGYEVKVSSRIGESTFETLTFINKNGKFEQDGEKIKSCFGDFSYTSKSKLLNFAIKKLEDALKNWNRKSTCITVLFDNGL